jgi:hypothetical protein
MPTKAEAMAQERADDAVIHTNAVLEYNKKYPRRPIGPFPNTEEAVSAAQLALIEDRELTDDERARIEYQDGDDIVGSEF